MSEIQQNTKVKKTQQRFSRTALNVIIILTALLILVLSQTGNLPTVTQDKAVINSPSEEETNKKTALETLESIPKSPLSEGRHIDIQHWISDKGAKVLFVGAPDIPMLDVRVIFDAGAARDSALPGLAGLTSDMLLEGSANYDVNQIAAHFEKLGAHIDSSAHRDMAIVQLRTLTNKKYLTPALTVFSEIISQPSFPTTSFTRNQKLMLLSLEQEKQSPTALISKRNFQALYQEHPYGIPPNGTVESLNALTVDDLKRFHNEFYVAQNAVIALVGAIDKKEAQAIANQIMQDLPKGEHAKPLPDIKPLDKAVVEHIQHPSQQTHILISTHSIDRTDDAYMPLYVGNEILGGSGFSSILNKEIRQDRGLSYSVYSYFSAMRSQGPFVISLQTKTESANQALSLVQENLNHFIDNGPTQAQLDQAIQNITSSFPLNTANNSSIVSYLGSIGFYGLPLDYLDTFTQKASKVTIEDIKNAFRQTIIPDKMVTLTLGQNEQKGESVTTVGVSPKTRTQ